MRNHNTLVLHSAAVLAVLAGTAHADITINAAGHGLAISVSRDLSIQVYDGGDAQLAGPGLLASVGGRLIGEGGARWTPLWQSRVSGDGTPEAPYTLDTVVGVDDLELAMQVRYVIGSDLMTIALAAQPGEVPVRLYHLIDARPNNPAGVYWDGEPAPNVIGLLADVAQVELIGTKATPWTSYQGGDAWVGAHHAALGEALDDELDPAFGSHVGMAVEWSYEGSWPVIEYQVRFEQLPVAGLGTSGAEPTDEPPPSDDGGSDDVGPPPTGPHGAAPIAGEDPDTSSDGDEAVYGSATDGAGCSAGGAGSSSAGLVLLLGLAFAWRRRR